MVSNFSTCTCLIGWDIRWYSCSKDPISSHELSGLLSLGALGVHCVNWWCGWDQIQPDKISQRMWNPPFFPVSPVSKQMSFHPSEKLFSTGFRLTYLRKLCVFLHMEIVLGFVCVGIYVLLFCLWSLRWYIKKDYSVLATHSFLPFLSPSSKALNITGHGVRQRGSPWKGFCFVQGSYGVRRTSM